jgi:hypothetical protein
MLFLRAKVIPVNPQIHGNEKKTIILNATYILADQMLKFIGSFY